jgi:putative transposase
LVRALSECWGRIEGIKIPRLELRGIPGLAASVSQTSARPFDFAQHRFYGLVVFTEKKRVEKLRYLHRNPVVRGLVLAPEQWNWSSYPHYALGEQGPVLVNEAQKAEMRVRGIA